jgi:hypothetical protein
MALAEEGSTLLGVPGAPGCTTTGFPESLCCAEAAIEMNTPKALAATNARLTIF